MEEREDDEKRKREEVKMVHWFARLSSYPSWQCLSAPPKPHVSSEFFENILAAGEQGSHQILMRSWLPATQHS
jgi:hypothetical protein